jgi:hypothetical protein
VVLDLRAGFGGARLRKASTQFCPEPGVSANSWARVHAGEAVSASANCAFGDGHNPLGRLMLALLAFSAAPYPFPLQ